jgi:hypothetical protein
VSARSFTSSKPDAWTLPRAHRDPGLRLHHYGKVLPMHRNRWKAAGINVRKDLTFGAIGMVLLAVCALGVGVIW